MSGENVKAAENEREIKGIRKVLIVPRGQIEEGVKMSKELSVPEVAEGIPPALKDKVTEDMLPYVYEEIIYKEDQDKQISDEMKKAAEKLGADIAEYYPTSDSSIEAGDLVSILDMSSSTLSVDMKYPVGKSTEAYDPKLLGVISDSSAVIINSGASSSDKINMTLRPLALAGRVLVKVSDENGPIKTGDYLTSSNIPGVAMKAIARGKVIGMALEDFDKSKITNEELGIGRIMMFVNVDWYSGSGSATSTDAILSGGLWENLNNLVSVVADTITGLPKMIVNGILEVKNDVLTHGAFKAIVKVAKTVVEGKTIIIDNAALAADSELEINSQDAVSLSFVTYSITSPRKEIMVSGSGKLLVHSTSSEQVEAKIAFHPYFSSVISEATPIRVIVTPTSYINGQLYVAEKSIYGFTIKEINSQDSGAEFDWLVTARLTDAEKAQEVLGNTQNIASQETVAVCESGANRACSSEVGVCRIGAEICEGGQWGSCIGAVFPTAEICDQVDNDCDGEVDEGGACGTAPIVESQATTTEPILNATTTEPIIISSTTDSIISSSTDSAISTSTATTTP